jgi:hypothetical protein
MSTQDKSSRIEKVDLIVKEDKKDSEIHLQSRNINIKKCYS